MRGFLAILGICTAAMVSTAAFADTFVYKDPDYKFTLSFPDTWKMQAPDEPTTRLRVAGPPLEDIASCRVKAEHDGRLQIYPKELMGTAVKETLDQAFWETEIGHYDRASLVEYRAPAGLGQGDATLVKMTYFLPGMKAGDRAVAMQGLMLATIYGDTRFVMSCSAKADVYERWVKLFGSVMGSIVFEDRYHVAATGYYRNFLMDPVFKAARLKPGTEMPEDIR